MNHLFDNLNNKKLSKKLQNEDNFELFKHKELLCLVKRIPYYGHLCGYVAVNEKHPLYKLDYADIYDKDILINVHGGLTYSDKNLISQEVFKNLWWFGFDCNHFRDIAPFVINNYSAENDYRDFEYVKDETKKLAEQLNNLRK